MSTADFGQSVSLSFRLASVLSLAATFTFAMLGAAGVKAQSQDLPTGAGKVLQAPVALPAVTQITPSTPNTAITSSLPKPSDSAVQPLGSSASDLAKHSDSQWPTTSLPELVDFVPVPETLPADIDCLAGAIYFEAKSESLAGQLAVGRVIVARTASGRFPTSYCGVVLQHSQFSFVRDGSMPAINRNSRTWRQMVKIALIADRGAWKSPAEGALFFHAARIGAIAGKTRVARIDNHVFYR